MSLPMSSQLRWRRWTRYLLLMFDHCGDGMSVNRTAGPTVRHSVVSALPHNALQCLYVSFVCILFYSNNLAQSTLKHRNTNATSSRVFQQQLKYSPDSHAHSLHNRLSSKIRQKLLITITFQDIYFQKTFISSQKSMVKRYLKSRFRWRRSTASKQTKRATLRRPDTDLV